MKLARQSAIISGANQGLGFEIARQFIAEGANVMLCARNAEKLFQAQKELSQQAANGVRVLAMPADISRPEQVEALVAEAIAQFATVDVLVANAAIHGAKGPIDEVDWQEWSDSIDINLKGTVLQCRAILPHFKKKQSGKIIILSGGGATKPMPYLSAYAASKAAIVRFAETIAEEVKKFGIEVNAVAPGALNTRLLDDILQAGPEKIGEAYYEQAVRQQQQGGTPLSTGAALCVFLASAESNGITGKLISAVWDPWTKLAEYAEKLKNSDIYTLRRIIPEDRGQTWEDTT